MRILITGASGCVGQYIVEELLDNTAHDLVLLLRDRNRLPLPEQALSRVVIIEGDLRDAANNISALDDIDVAVLLATAWGGEDTFDITVTANAALADRLIAQGCRCVLYFATASVLTSQRVLSDAARDLGTDYIRAKWSLVGEMEKRAGKAHIAGLFPTLVLGGRVAHPTKPLSHFAKLLVQIAPWMKTGRFLSAPGRFNIIHARDIAVMVRHLCERPTKSERDNPERIVLGNPARTVDELVAEFCRYTGRTVRPLISITPRLAGVLIRMFRIRLSPWDKYCMENPDQSYADAACPATFGLNGQAPELADGLEDIGIAKRR